MSKPSDTRRLVYRGPEELMMRDMPALVVGEVYEVTADHAVTLLATGHFKPERPEPKAAPAAGQE